jgi:hypothetical protein
LTCQKTTCDVPRARVGEIGQPDLLITLVEVYPFGMGFRRQDTKKGRVFGLASSYFNGGGFIDRQVNVLPAHWQKARRLDE